MPAFPCANPSSLCSSSIYPYTSSSSPSPFVLVRFFICLATPPTSRPSPSAASCPAVFAALSGPLSIQPAPRRLSGCPSVHPSVARCCYLPRHSCAHPALPLPFLGACPSPAPLPAPPSCSWSRRAGGGLEAPQSRGRAGRASASLVPQCCWSMPTPRSPPQRFLSRGEHLAAPSAVLGAWCVWAACRHPHT